MAPNSKLTPAVVRRLSAQLARQLGIAYAIVDRRTLKLKSVGTSRRIARLKSKDLGGAKVVRVIRVDLRVKGLRA